MPLSCVAEQEACALLAMLAKYSPDQPRDDRGRFDAGDVPARLKWINHPVLGTRSGVTTTNKPVEHLDLIGKAPVYYDAVNRGGAYLSGNMAHAWTQGGADAVVSGSFGRPKLDEESVEHHLKSTYGVKDVMWHANRTDALASIRGVIGAEKIKKANPKVPPPADPDDQSEAAKRARRNIKKEVNETFDFMRDKVAQEASDAFDHNDNASEVLDSIDLGTLDDLASGTIPDALHDVFVNAGRRALDSMGVDDQGIVDLFNRRARDYAADRGAELVGRRWVNGKLVDNPDAKWAITDTTRDKLRSLIAKSYEDGKTPVELAQQIQDSFLFSEGRAEMIAKTETAKASVQGSVGAWRESGVVKGKSWQVSNDEGVCEECDGNQDEGIVALDDDFSSGDDAPPAHPLCRCALAASIEGPDEDEEEGDAEKLAKAFVLEKHDYGCTMVDIDPDGEVGKLMQSIGNGIDPQDLVGSGVETDPHVTVRYGIKPGSSLSELERYFRGLKPFIITFGDVTSFPPSPHSDDAAVIKVDVTSPELQRINQEVVRYAVFKEANFEYHPHATIAYVKPSAVGRYIGNDALNGKTTTVTSITIRNVGDPTVVEFSKLAKDEDHREGWIGVDLDGTLAHYDGDHSKVGEPTAMVQRVKAWLAAGEDVRIFTARVHDDPDGVQRKMIEQWCAEHLGRVLPITCVKDHQMVELWDDRAVRVGRNTGNQLSPSEKMAKVGPEDEASVGKLYKAGRA